MHSEILDNIRYRVPVDLHYAFNRPDAVLFDEKLAYHDDLFFFEVSVVEYRAFGLRKSHTASLAFEHLVAFGVESLLNDVSGVLLSVVRTVRIQTYLVIWICPIHRIYYAGRGI